MSSHYAPTNGIQYHYLDYGGEGRTIVLLHGLTANAYAFQGLINAGLTDYGHVLSLDLRGRGRSDKPKSGYTMEDHAKDVVGLLERLGCEAVTVAGHSFGGLLTYYLAAKYPQYVDRCIVMDAPADVHEGILDQIQPSLARLEQTWPSFEEYLHYVKAMPYYPDGWWDSALEVYYRADVELLHDGSVKPRSNPDHIRQCAEGTLKVDWHALVSKIAQPVLFLRAPEPFGPPNFPPLVPAEQAQATMKRLKNGTLAEGVGNHITYLFGDNAKLIVQTIGQWLEHTEDAMSL
ncbi:MAG: alpha/beta hydrolase [Phototrophicales bacterium]|nr:MAG: alpha/beta hydrolase [Phototrophicales bacterium]